jgi:hypothetical protein
MPNGSEPTTATLASDVLRLDVAIEPDVRLSVTDKRTGAVWTCPGSPLALSYWDAYHFATRTAPVTPATGWRIRLTSDDGPLGLHCTWARAACGFRAVFTLEDDTLEVTFPSRRFIENRPFDACAMGLAVLPAFGAVPTGEDGFLFVPRGRGVVCRFDKDGPRESSLLVYSEGQRGLTAPVFGTARPDGGLFGVVREGEFDAELVVAANTGPQSNLNTVYPRLRLRMHSCDPVDEIDRRVRYTFLTGDDASVVGMARTYRTYLTDVAGHGGVAGRAEYEPLFAAASRVPAVHVHLSQKRSKSRLTGDGELRVRTRFDDLPAMAETLKGAGLGDATIVLVGWNAEGRDGLYPTRFPVEYDCGGADGMGRALNAIRELGFQVGALDNYTDMYRRSPGFNDALAAKQLGGEPWRGGIWVGGQAYVICPDQALERHVARDMRRLRDLGLEGMLLLDHFPGPGVLRCYDDEHPLTRSQYAKKMTDLVRVAQRTFGLCQVSDPCVFAALAAGMCLCPVAEPPPTDELAEDWFADAAVPFLPLALHGVVALAAEADRDPLRCVEYGAAPVFNVTAGSLGAELPSLVDLAKRYRSEIAPLAGQAIRSHEADGDLVRVGYADGPDVLLNRSDEPQQLDGADIPPQNFVVR